MATDTQLSHFGVGLFPCQSILSCEDTGPGVKISSAPYKLVNTKLSNATCAILEKYTLALLVNRYTSSAFYIRQELPLYARVKVNYAVRNATEHEDGVVLITSRAVLTVDSASNHLINVDVVGEHVDEEKLRVFSHAYFGVRI